MEIGKYFDLLMQGKTEQAEELRLKGIPDTLIKYVGLDGTDTDIDEKKFETLEHDSIWFTPKDNLNDPYEFKGILIDRPKLEEIEIPSALIDEFESILDFSNYGITCLTANLIDYLPMWAYYTNNHKGFCIEYETIKKIAIHEVLYEPERIKLANTILRAIAATRNAFTTGSNSEMELYTNLLLQGLFIKAASWKHEKEYRITLSLGCVSKVISRRNYASQSSVAAK